MFHSNIENLYVINPKILNKGVVFYGAGNEAHRLYRNLVRLGMVRLIGVYDNNKQGKSVLWNNVKILSREEFKTLDKNTPIIIATKQMNLFQEMAHDALSLGFECIVTGLWPAIAKEYDTARSREIINESRKEIEYVRNIWDDAESIRVFDTILEYRLTNDYRLLLDIREEKYNQYFPQGEIFEPENGEIFIDAGSLNALTIQDLKEWTGDSYSKAYCFEPSDEDRVVVDESINFYNLRAKSIDAGLYNKNGTVRCASAVMGLSSICDTGDIEIKVVRLDDYMETEQQKVTFIKMDIEGSELEALEGAAETIKKDHPKLAICVYHKFTDLWMIPIWIKSRFPQYKIYLRHHSVTNNETVLYAKWGDS